MNKKEISFCVSEETKQAFELALFISNKSKDEVFESLVRDFAATVLRQYRTEPCTPPLETDFVENCKPSKEDKSKALAKIPIWATSRKGQIGAQIVKAFFVCEIDGVASRDSMRNVFLQNNPDKNPWSFDNNLASMCTEKGNSHGLFFVISGDNVRPDETIKDELYLYRDDFLETRKEEIPMGYKLCPICQLNMIEDDKEQCNVCGGNYSSTNQTRGYTGRSMYVDFYRKDVDSITKGDILSNDEVSTFFKCSTQGGMRKSNTTNSLVLINDKDSIYEDSWKDGICLYTGMGMEGDQSFHERQNWTLYNSCNSSVKVYLFERAYSRYTYVGRVELAAEPYYGTQKDRRGLNRRVCIFPLKIVEGEDTIKKNSW